MELRALGSTGINVSTLSLGTVKFGRNQGVKYPHAFDLPSDGQIINLLALAHELGINMLDTAPAYGTSETRLGQLLQNKQDWIICTKVGESFDNTTGQSSFDFSAKATQSSVENSLRVLKRDWLDIVLIHSNGDDERILYHEECLDALLALKQQGKIRAVGMSSKTCSGGLQALAHCDVLMVTHNLHYQDELSVIQQAHAQNKGILIKKGLLSGHLQSDFLSASLRLILGESGVSSIVMGTLNPAHLRANVETANQLLAV